MSGTDSNGGTLRKCTCKEDAHAYNGISTHANTCPLAEIHMNEFADSYLSKWAAVNDFVFTRDELIALGKILRPDLINALAELRYDAKQERTIRRSNPLDITAEQIADFKKRAAAIREYAKPGDAKV